jgi:predicted secreted Zn-dependent protease
MIFLLVACADGPPPGPIVDADVLWFDLEGRDRIDLLQSCTATCPRDDAGIVVSSLTSWAVDWTWKRSGPPCQVSDAALEVDLTVVLPRWDAPSDADPALVAEWRAYLDALAVHEQGHVDLVRTLAAGTERGITEAGCADAPAVGARVIEQIRFAGAAYDANTQSGRTQGADFWRMEE